MKSVFANIPNIFFLHNLSSTKYTIENLVKITAGAPARHSRYIVAVAG